MFQMRQMPIQDFNYLNEILSIEREWKRLCMNVSEQETITKLLSPNKETNYMRRKNVHSVIDLKTLKV